LAGECLDCFPKIIGGLDNQVVHEKVQVPKRLKDLYRHQSLQH
jgi:hypothetical protein